MHHFLNHFRIFVYKVIYKISENRFKKLPSKVEFIFPQDKAEPSSEKLELCHAREAVLQRLNLKIDTSQNHIKVIVI